MRYSIVIPVHDEAGNIQPLHDEILTIAKALGQPYEVIYVDDGSDEATKKELRGLTNATVVTLNRNYGQSTALDAGFKLAQGEIIISLDGDGQNDPADIPTLLDHLHNNPVDVVVGWRKERNDVAGIKVLTRIGRMLRGLLIHDTIHDTGCTLRAYTRQAIQTLDLQGEMHRYIVPLLRWKGFRIEEIAVNDRKRLHGQSKYGLSKSIRGFIDLIYIWFIHKYSQRPLHLFGYVSMLLATSGAALLAVAVYQKISFDIGINRSGYFLLGAFSLLISIMLVSFGVVIDLLIKIYLNGSPCEKRYHIRSIENT
jgi:glycosyltransferase involved in cell wall biosynthesis